MPKVEITCPTCGDVRLRWPHEAKKQKPYCKRCGNSAQAKAQMTTHGARYHPLYLKWKNIRRRISDPRYRDYIGLDMDPAWENVWVFIHWATGAGWRADLSIERKNNSRGYWPDNCCFIPLGDQARHTRRNTMNWDIAKEVRDRIAAGEIKNHVAKAVAEKHKISYWTVAAVAYNRAWRKDARP